MGTQCLNHEIMPRDLLIFEKINNICCRQVRFESMRIPRYLTYSPSFVEELKNFFIIKELYRSSYVSDKAEKLQNWISLC